jgi:hypothetical protein
MDRFLFRFFDTVWEAIRGVFRNKRSERQRNKK